MTYSSIALSNQHSSLRAWEEHLRTFPILSLTPSAEDVLSCEEAFHARGLAYTTALMPLYRGLDSRWTQSIAKDRTVAAGEFSKRFDTWKSSLASLTPTDDELATLRSQALKRYERSLHDEWMTVAAPKHIRDFSAHLWEDGRVETAALVGDLMGALGKGQLGADDSRRIAYELYSARVLSGVLEDRCARPGDHASIFSRLVFVSAPVVASCDSPCKDIPGDIRTEQTCPGCSGLGETHFKDELAKLKADYRERRQECNTGTSHWSEITLPRWIATLLRDDPAAKAQAVACL